MNRFAVILLLAICLLSCRQGVALVDREAVAVAVSRQMAACPESRLQDFYKSFFQDRFGPGHTCARDRLWSGVRGRLGLQVV